VIAYFAMEFGLHEGQHLAADRARTEMERCRSEVDPALLARYDQLKECYGVRAIVEVQDHTCSGCRISLPKTAVNRLRSDVVLCDHCGRILYSPDHAYHFHY